MRELIDALARNAVPVRRVRPLARALLWLAIAALVLGLVGLGQGLRPDLADRLRQPVFDLGLGASLATGILAAIAASFTSLPDRSRLWSLLPVPPLLLWFSTIGLGCIGIVIGLVPGSITFGELARCFATLMLTSVPLSAALLVMLRHGVLVRPGAVALCGSLAVAALTATALTLFHELDATVMIFMLNLGMAALVVGLAGIFGRRMLRTARPRAVS